MGFNMTFEDDDKLQVYLSEIIQDGERSEKEMLKETGEKLKGFIEQNLNVHRRTLAVRYKGRQAMADDVKLSIRTNPGGVKYARLSGGKMTGTLWHLVNDGTLHTNGTHFMDGALARLDGDIEKVWDKILK